MVSILPLSSLSILLLSPTAISNINLVPPLALSWPLNQPFSEIAALPTGVKHSRCRPESAAVKVNLAGLPWEPLDVNWETTR